MSALCTVLAVGGIQAGRPVANRNEFPQGFGCPFTDGNFSEVGIRASELQTIR